MVQLRHIFQRVSAILLELSSQRYFPLGFDLIGDCAGDSRCRTAPLDDHTWVEILSSWVSLPLGWEERECISSLGGFCLPLSLFERLSSANSWRIVFMTCYMSLNSFSGIWTECSGLVGSMSDLLWWWSSSPSNAEHRCWCVSGSTFSFLLLSWRFTSFGIRVSWLLVSVRTSCAWSQ